MHALNVALATLLKTDVLAAGATGFYRGEAPQGATPPYMVFRKQSGTTGGVTHDRHDIPARLVYLFKVVDKSESIARAETILAVVHYRLHMQTVTVSGRGVLPTFWLSDIEYTESVQGVQFQHVGKLYAIKATP